MVYYTGDTIINTRQFLKGTEVNTRRIVREGSKYVPKYVYDHIQIK